MTARLSEGLNFAIPNYVIIFVRGYGQPELDCFKGLSVDAVHVCTRDWILESHVRAAICTTVLCDELERTLRSHFDSSSQGLAISSSLVPGKMQRWWYAVVAGSSICGVPLGDPCFFTTHNSL